MVHSWHLSLQEMLLYILVTLLIPENIILKTISLQQLKNKAKLLIAFLFKKKPIF